MSLDSPPLDSYWYWFAQKCLSSPPRRAEAVWSASSVPAGAKLHFARHSFKKWALRIKDSLNWAASGRTKEVTNGNTGSNSVLRSKSLFKSGVYSSRGKEEDNCLFLVVTFLQFDLGSQPQQIRATDASRLLETEGFIFIFFIICAPLGGSLPNTGLCPLWSA